MTQHLCWYPQAALICHNSAVTPLCFGTNKSTDKSWLCHNTTVAALKNMTYTAPAT